MFLVPPFLAVFFAQNPNLFRTQAQAGFLFCALVLAIHLGVRAKSWVVGITFFYFALNAILVFAAPIHTANWDLPDGAAILPGKPREWAVAVAGQSFLWLSMIATTVSIISDKTRHAVMEALAWVCFGTAVLLLFKWAFGLDPANVVPYAWMNNRAADASMLSVLFPVMAFRPRRYRIDSLLLDRLMVFTVILAVTVCGSSTGYLALLLSILAYFWHHRKSPQMALMGFALVALTLPGLLFLKHALLADSGRHEAWVLMMSYWWGNVPVWMGSGAGAYFQLGPAVQQANGYASGSIFAYLHQEFLQILFEQGVVGLGIFLVFCATILRRAYCKPWVFAALLTYGFTMLSQFPLRMFMSAMIGALLIRESCEEG